MIIFFLIFLFSFQAHADSWKNLGQGDKTAHSLLDQMNAKKQETGAHPFFQGISKESNIPRDNLKGQTQQCQYALKNYPLIALKINPP